LAFPAAYYTPRAPAMVGDFKPRHPDVVCRDRKPLRHGPTACLKSDGMVWSARASNMDALRVIAFGDQDRIAGLGGFGSAAGIVSVTSRLKRSGMFWTIRGANAIVLLRCCCLNGQCEDYWDRHARAIPA